MSLQTLLNNQTIRLDAHNKGDGQPLRWGKELHLHKTTNDINKKRKVDVLLYIVDEEKDIEFRSKNDKDNQKIVTEIKKAFKDDVIRTRFIQSLYKTLGDFQLRTEIKDKEKRRTNMRMAAQKIVELFGFKSSIMKIFNKELDIFYDKQNDIYVRANEQTTFTIGHNKDNVIDF